MKNPFKQNDNTSTWIFAAIAGAITVGVVAFLYFKKNEENAEEDDDHTTEYLQLRVPKKRKQRTDVHELEDIVAHSN
jgi:hypothetical protein